MNSAKQIFLGRKLMITVKELMTSPDESSPDGRHWEPGIPKKAAPWWITLRDAWAVLKGQAVAIRQTTKEDLKDKTNEKENN